MLNLKIDLFIILNFEFEIMKEGITLLLSKILG